MDPSAFIGQTAGPYAELASEDRIAAFQKAIGTSDPGVPPTFLTVFRRGEFELLERMGVSLAQVLHAEQEYEFFSELRSGDFLDFTTQLANAALKKGASGSLKFLTFETEFARNGVRVAVARTILVVRET